MSVDVLLIELRESVLDPSELSGEREWEVTRYNVFSTPIVDFLRDIVVREREIGLTTIRV